MFVRLALFAFAFVSSSAQAQSLPAAPLSLDDAIRTAFQNQGDVLASNQQLSAASERITFARSARAPQLSASVGSNYLNSPTIVVPGVGNGTGTTFSQTGSTFSTGVSVSQNLFDSGRTRESIRQSRATFDIARGSLGTTRTSLAFQVAQRFFEQLRQETLVGQRFTQLELTQGSLRQIEAQIEAGTSPRSDLLGAQVNVSQARFDLTTARNALKTAQIDLRAALGLPDGPPLNLVSELPPVPALQSGDELLALARSRRPDLQGGQAQIRQGQSQLKAAQIESRPNVAANLALNLDPRSNQNRRFNVGATLSIPIFNAGGLRANVRAARDELSASQIRLAQLGRTSDASVRSALVNIEGQRARVEVGQELVALARQNLEVARGRYGAGVGIALDITTAQSQLFGAQTSLTGARFDLQIALANLDLATGRFASETPAPATKEP